MLPSDRALCMTLTDEQAVALTIYGEARNQKIRGKLAVGFVIWNRSKLWKKPVKEICYSNDFDCWDTGNPNLDDLMMIVRDWAGQIEKDQALRNCLIAAQGVLSRNILSNVPNCTFYKRADCKAPWFDKAIGKSKLIRVCQVGDHEFFKEKQYE